MMMAGSSAEVSAVANSSGRRFDRRPERFGAGVDGIAGHVDVLQIGQPVADFRERLPSAFVSDNGLGAGIGQTNSSASSPNSVNSGTDTRPERNARQMHRSAVPAIATDKPRRGRRA